MAGRNGLCGHAPAREVGGELAKGRDCFVYFNNYYRGYAVRNALELEDRLRGKEAGQNA